MPTKATDTIWATIRRLIAQVQSMNEAISTLRRDINRIDKSIYRAKDKDLATEIAERPGDGGQQHHPALFG